MKQGGDDGFQRQRVDLGGAAGPSDTPEPADASGCACRVDGDRRSLGTPAGLDVLGLLALGVSARRINRRREPYEGAGRVAARCASKSADVRKAEDGEADSGRVRGMSCHPRIDRPDGLRSR